MRIKLHLLLWTTALGIASQPVASAASLFAAYTFDYSLAADQGGVPALITVDPGGTSGFTTATVFGTSRTAYQWIGDNSSPGNEAGLSFDASSINANDYSVQMVFELTQNAFTWRRILDVQNRASDSGFYLDPNGLLNLAGEGVSLANGSDNVGLNTFYDVVLVNSGGTVSGYLDGALQFSVATTVMDVNNPGNLVNLFLDNTQGLYGNEYSNGEIALFKVWNGGLTAQDVTTLDHNPLGTVPEPSGWFMTACGLGLLVAGLSRRQLFTRSLR
jgi:Concanavalin A-like lectin/glucanases superfamily